jgi:hypothetical protein
MSLPREIRWSPGPRAFVIPGAVGLCALGLGVLLGERADFFRAYLTSLTFYLSLALGALVFVLLSHLMRAGWSVALRRVAEIVAWTLVPLAPLTLLILFGMHDLYEWTHADAVAADALLEHKQAWLNPTFFVIRVFVYVVVWAGMALLFLRRSLAQDRTGDPELTVRNENFAGPATIVFAFSVTFASFDLLMSLDPHWYSTIYGVYFFAGAFLGFVALLVVLLSILGRTTEISRLVHTEHRHDLGKLLFAFIVFWAYIGFSQYMLIWYSNLPEETVWYAARQSGAWAGVSWLLVIGHFLAPFLALMSRHPKRRSTVLLVAALWILAMHALDLFWLVMPSVRTSGPIVHLVDVVCFVGLGGLFFSALAWRMARVNLVALRDPRLDESLGFENA